MKPTLLILSALLLTVPAAQAAPADAEGDADAYCYVYQTHDLVVAELRLWGGTCVGYGYTIHGPDAVCDRGRLCDADHVFVPAVDA